MTARVVDFSSYGARLTVATAFAMPATFSFRARGRTYHAKSYGVAAATSACGSYSGRQRARALGRIDPARTRSQADSLKGSMEVRLAKGLAEPAGGSELRSHSKEIRECEVADPDMAMIGSEGLCSRMRLMTSKPSISGMKMSTISKSKSSLWIA
jgi:hypothetical protein